MRKKLLLKPHHFLDILKLYGTGLDNFIPDKKYCHDFYKIGNIILKNPLAIIQLTTGVDDICKPCYFLKNNKCIDKMQNDFIYLSKQEWNEVIDERILKKLDLKEWHEASAVNLCKYAQKKLTRNDIADIWKERPHDETIKRIKYLLIGLDKYIKKFLLGIRRAPPKKSLISRLA